MALMARAYIQAQKFGAEIAIPVQVERLHCQSAPNGSPHRQATKHFHATRHPIIEGYDPPEGWGWCYVDEVTLDLSGRTTPQRGPIPRYA